MNHSVLQRVDKDFVKYMKQVYGNLDMPVITRKHTSVLQEILSKRNKRASLYDVFYWIIMLSMIGLVLLLGATFVDKFNEKAQNSPIFDTGSKAVVQGMSDLYPNYIDKGFVLAFIGEVMITIILGGMIAVHPVFFVFYIPGWIFAVYLSAIMSDIYQKAAQTNVLNGIADRIPWTSYMIIWMPMIIGVAGILLAIFMYKTWKSNNE